MDAEEDLIGRLLAEYSQSIDTSTLLAILSDFDLNDETQLASARQTLDILKESVPAEEESGFDASAAAAGGRDRDTLREMSGNAFGETESDSTRSAPGWTTSTDNTSINQDILSDLEGLVFDQPAANAAPISSGEETPGSELDALDDEGKEKALVGIFPAFKPFDIKWTLKRCKWDASLAIDELMTQSFLEESGARHKGIEAFSQESLSKPKKSRVRKGKHQLKTESVKSSSDESPIQSKWDSGRQDVEFLSEKTGMPMPQISSIYHKNGASVRATISAIIKAHNEVNLEVDDSVIQITAYELRGDYPSLSVSDLEALLQIANPSYENAKDLAKALSTRQESSDKTGAIQLDYRHAPPVLDEAQPSSKGKKTQSRKAPTDPIDFQTAASKAESLYQARETAQLQASSAYRKARSDPLMGAAAGYYSQVGRDLGDRARGMESQAADALVAQQSSRTELDLHGVSVKDAVRISRERVTGWWHEMGGRPGGAAGGYKIVTGLGKHSEGGRGKLGPAVGKILIREGWKVEVGSGALVVRGVERK